MNRIAAILLLLVTCPALAGTDASPSFRFTNYLGPAGFRSGTNPEQFGTINGELLTTIDSLGTHYIGDTYTGFRTQIDAFPVNTTSVRFELYTAETSNNRLTFSPTELVDVELGETVLLGTLELKNGSWLNDSIGSQFGWEIKLQSTDPVLDGLLMEGVIRFEQNDNTTSGPNSNDPDTGADWIYFPAQPELGSFRVFDRTEGPIGQGSIGHVELWATLGSGNLESMRNPSNGFLARSVIADPDGLPAQPAVALFSAILPSSRSVTVDFTATAFATLINAGQNDATLCRIDLLDSFLPVDFSFQTTVAATNAPLGEVNEPINIPAGSAQTFIVSLTPHELMSATEVEFDFVCNDADSAVRVTGVNSLLLSAALSSVPDIVALAATASRDGIVKLAPSTLNGVFVVASVNLGRGDRLSVSADDLGGQAPVTLAMCQTDPISSICINPTVPATVPVEVDIDAGATPTFAVFPSASTAIPLDPAGRRVFVRFTDSAGVTRGSTSVAIQTIAPVISAGDDLTVASGERVTLTGSAVANGLQIETVNWAQLSGSPILLTGATTDTPTFQLPASACSQEFVFSYAASYSNGVTASDFVYVRSIPDIGGFSVTAGPDRVLLTGPYIDRFERFFSASNTISLAGRTDLAPCNVDSAQWQQTAGEALDFRNFSAGRGIELQTRISNEDELLEFEFSVKAVDDRVEAERIKVHLIGAREIPMDEVAPQNFRLIGATDTDIFGEGRFALHAVDRASGIRRQVSPSIKFHDSEGDEVEFSGASGNGIYAPAVDRLLSWHERKLLSIDPNLSTTIEQFSGLQPPICCTNDMAFNSTDLFALTESTREESRLFRASYTQDQEEIEPLATIMGINYRMFADGRFLYLYKNVNGNSTMIGFDLDTRLQSSVIADRGTIRGSSNQPIIAAQYIYWEGNGKLFEIDRVTHAVRTVTQNLGATRYLIVQNDWVYALRLRGELVRANLSDGTVEELVTLPNLVAVAAVQGTIYGVTETSFSGSTVNVYRYVPDTGFELFRELSERGVGANRVLGVGEHLLLHANDRLVFLNVSTNEVKSIREPGSDLSVLNGDLWWTSGGSTLGRLVGGIPPQPPEILADLPEGYRTEEVLLADDTLYAVHRFENPETSTTSYELRSTDTAGQNSTTLFTSTSGTLSGLGVHDERLYFACLDACGDGWAVVWVPTVGGATPIVATTLESFTRLEHGRDRMWIHTSGVQNIQMLELPNNNISTMAFAGDMRIVDRGDHLYLFRSSELERYEFSQAYDQWFPQQIDYELGNGLNSSQVLESIVEREDELLFFDTAVRRLAD